MTQYASATYYTIRQNHILVLLEISSRNGKAIERANTREADLKRILRQPICSMNNSPELRAGCN